MKSLLKSIQYGMLDIIEGEDAPDYSSQDVTTCITYLLEFMSTMAAEPQTSASTKKHIKELILDLNELNETCDHTLIETDQREEICLFIEKVTSVANVSFDDDITQEWRQW